ncbi:hypothetical protein, partial [Acinetobacter pittii]|uniref:hypothetical protein n=1 Tax=Acinetobacter pittii TaxID=48296 RepID=UPI002813BDAA
TNSTNKYALKYTNSEVTQHKKYSIKSNFTKQNLAVISVITQLGSIKINNNLLKSPSILLSLYSLL